MKNRPIIRYISFCFVLLSLHSCQPKDQSGKEADNRKNAIEFYRTAFLGNPRAAVEKYVGERYIQHNPSVSDGKEGFIEYFERMHREYPDKTIEFVRAVAQDSLVALHTHQIWQGWEGPGTNEWITMDFFRFDDKGKIVEHWDAIQQVPETSRNDNKMY